MGPPGLCRMQWTRDVHDNADGDGCRSHLELEQRRLRREVYACADSCHEQAAESGQMEGPLRFPAHHSERGKRCEQVAQAQEEHCGRQNGAQIKERAEDDRGHGLKRQADVRRAKLRVQLCEGTREEAVHGKRIAQPSKAKRKDEVHASD